MSLERVKLAVQQLLSRSSEEGLTIAGPRQGMQTGFRVLDYATQDLDPGVAESFQRRLRATWTAVALAGTALVGVGAASQLQMAGGGRAFDHMLAGIEATSRATAAAPRDIAESTPSEAREPLQVLSQLSNSHILHFQPGAFDASVDFSDLAPTRCRRGVAVTHCQVRLPVPQDGVAGSRAQLANIFVAAQGASRAVSSGDAPRAADAEELAYRLYLDQAQADAFGVAFMTYWGEANGAGQTATELAGYQVLLGRLEEGTADPARNTASAVATAMGALDVSDLVQQRLALLSQGADEREVLAQDVRAARAILVRSRLEELRSADGPAYLSRAQWKAEALASLASAPVAQLMLDATPWAARLGVQWDEPHLALAVAKDTAAARARELGHAAGTALAAGTAPGQVLEQLRRDAEPLVRQTESIGPQMSF